MSTLREAAKHALDALEYAEANHGGDDCYADSITALRAALAEPVQEPFGYFRAEPFGWTDCADTDEGAIPLYTAPPQRKPLTEEVIDSVWDSEKAFADIYAIVRAIERAHGIT